jgi:hypothetical protein
VDVASNDELADSLLASDIIYNNILGERQIGDFNINPQEFDAIALGTANATTDSGRGLPRSVRVTVRGLTLTMATIPTHAIVA